MNWFFYALLAPALYALVVFIDKYIVGAKVKDYRAVPLFAAIAGFFGGTIIWIFTGFSLINFNEALVLLFTGILNIILFVLYYEAVAQEEASVINILFQMFPVFVLVLSFVIFREVILSTQFIGFFLVLFAVLGITYKKTKKKFSISRSFYLILLYDIIWAISVIVIKYFAIQYPLKILISYQGWGTALGGALFYFISPSVRKAFLRTVNTVDKTTIGVLFTNEGLFIGARAMTFLAFSLGPTALVSVLEGTTVFYGILYGIVASGFAPGVFKEDVSKKGLQKKLFFAFILFIGIWFIYQF